MEKSNCDAVFMGACIMDMITYTSRFAKPGETLAGTHFHKGTGGKGPNGCVMAAKLGLKTLMLAKIGNDAFGDEMVDNFDQLSINRDHVLRTHSSHTSVAAICVTENGENSIVYVPGSADLFVARDIDLIGQGIFADTKLFVTTFECPSETILAALRLAKKHNVRTLVNAAPPFPLPVEDIDEIFQLSDILCMNESETEAMTQCNVATDADIAEAMTYLFNKGCQTVILTLGEKGAYFGQRETKQVVHVPVKQVNCVDTTGAGDAFVGSLAYYFVCHPHLSMKDMIERSCEIATLTVMKKGTQSSYPSRSEIDERLFA